MEYVGDIIRPPSEANSIILQATVGCSHNRCTFCGAYKDKRFAIKESGAIRRDLEFAARYCRAQKRLFIADGDALVIPFARLHALCEDIRVKLPWVRRISLYGSARSIRTKSVEQLRQLKRLGLDRIYLGLESGDDQVLRDIGKGETGKSMVAAASTVNEAGLFLSVTVLLGIAGRQGTVRHAEETARILGAMRPRQIAALTYMPLANTSLGHKCLNGEFALPNALEMLAELRMLVACLEVTAQFHANHASNYLPIAGRLPRDRQLILSLIDEAIGGQRRMVPESFRRL